MITKELLHKNKDYVLTHMEELHYASTSNPMFVDGKFSQYNWNGGDDIIREFLSYIECCDDLRQIYQNEDMVMIVYYKVHEDTHYVDIVCVKSYHDKVYVNRYFFSRYKHRGRIDTAEYNGKILLESDYIKLLNNIEKMTNFKFKFY